MQAQDGIAQFRITRWCGTSAPAIVAELPPSPVAAYTVLDSLGSIPTLCDTLQYRLEAILTDGTSRVLGHRTIALRSQLYGEQLFLRYRLPKRTAVTIDLIGLDGRKMALLRNPNHPGGNFVLTFPLSSERYAQETFFVRLRTPSQQVIARVQRF